MTVLNTFWILFKSNSEDAIKANKAVEKSTKETEAALKNGKESVDKFGQSFVKMIENAAGAAGALVGFNILKNGVLTAVDFNKQLYITSQLTGQNIQMLKAMGQASRSIGGSNEGSVANLTAIANQAAQNGLAFNAADYLRNVRQQVKLQTTAAGRNRVIQNAQLSDPGLQMLALLKSDKEFEDRLATATKQVPFNDAQGKAALDTAGKIQETAGTLGNYFTKLSEAIKPVIDGFTTLAQKVLGAAGGSGTASVVGGAAFVGASALGGRWALRSVAGALGRGAAAAGTGLVSGASALGAAALAAGAVPGYYLTKWYLDSKDNKGTIPQAPLTKSRGKTGNADLDFWVSQGYTPAQAAGIMANIHHESKGDPRAIGDGGRAVGLAQWHPHRVASILKGTGIDVRTAGRQDQLRAMAWELKNGDTGFDDAKFRTINDANMAGQYVSTHYERPADRIGQALARGKTALGLASQTGFVGAGGGTSVRIDKIDVVTQATDANGIAKDLKHELHSQLTILAANVDDGVAR